MTEIALVEDLLPYVLSGEKTATIRRGKRDWEIGPAEIVSGNVRVPIKINRVTYVKLRDMREADAWEDGFDSVNELKETLKIFYSHLSDEDVMTIVHFYKT